MTKEQKTQRLLNNFDLRLSWLFAPDKITIKATDDGTRYTIKDALNGTIELHARKGRAKNGTPPHLDIFGRFENGREYFKDANQYTGKYNFFGLDKDGIDHYMNTVLTKLSTN